MKHIKYYVDESGDLSLFNRKGKVVDTSRTIMLGLLKIKDPDFNVKFRDFKTQILEDPIFKTFPSHQKTSRSFHAKDDHIAIRREVYKFLKGIDLSVQVALRRRSSLAEYARSIYLNYNKKYTPKEIYNDLVARLFKGKIHKADSYEIFFSHRGNTTENKSIYQALQKADENFQRQWGIISNSDYKIICRHPNEEAGLQVIDYCLWALQRLYEKEEDVYFKLIEDKFKLIMDIDDKRNNQYGEYYKTSNTLTLDKIKG